MRQSPNMAKQTIEQALQAAASAHLRFAATDLKSAVMAAEWMRQAVLAEHKILAFGNGGSATDAQHFAAELVGRFMRERRPLGAIALSADSAVLTCLGNDYGYAHVFERQLRALARPGDICLAITTSGDSPNILAGLRAVREMGIRSIALTGRSGGEAGRLADLHINISEASTARIQEVQRTLLHALCEIVELAV